MVYPKYTLTGKTPAQTYENLVQFNSESSSLVNGDGNDITASLNLTVTNAVSASYAPGSGGENVREPIYLSNASNFYNTNGVGVGDVLLSFHDTTIGDSGSAFIGIGSGDPESDRSILELFADSNGSVGGLYVQTIDSGIGYSTKLNTADGLLINNNGNNVASINMDGTFANGGASIGADGVGNFNYLGARSITLSQGAFVTGDLTAATITGSLLGTASYALAGPGGGGFNGTASYFDNGNGSTINGNGFANLGIIIVNDPSIPVVALLSGHGFYQDEVHGRVGFNGRFDDTQPNSYFESSRVEGRKDVDSPNYGGALVLMTSDSTGTLIDRVHINSTGSVGIGTNNPQYNVDITGDIGNSNGGGDGIHNTPGYRITSKAGSTYFNINGGNVGIATTNPQSTLDVNGDINFTGTLNSNGTSGITTTQTFKDGSNATKTMTITNGIITAIV